MSNLKDILTEEEMKLAEKMASEIAEKIFLDFSNKKETFAKELDDLKIEDEKLKAQYLSISDWKERNTMMEMRQNISKKIKLLESKIVNVDNQLKALINRGNVVSFDDKIGKTHEGIADFREVKTDIISFDVDTILVEPLPEYIPIIDEEKFERRGAILDAIRITTDTYLVAYGSYNYNDSESIMFLLTLDQLVLTNLYYITKLKALYKKKAQQKTERSKQSYFSLPLERRLRHYAQRGYYNTLNKTLKSKYSEEEWNNLPLEKKEELAPAYKIYGSEKIKSKLGEEYMYASYHDMYNVFIDPQALKVNKDRTKTYNIGESAYGAFANHKVFQYWVQFREMMNYKIKDIEFQRAEMSENYKTAIETSFGESNTEKTLLSTYGVLVKRQNGDKINASEVAQIEEGLNLISNVFGNLKEKFIKNNIKISHTGKKLVFAQKAVGVYIPTMGTIAISDKYGEIQFNSTFAHELAHFIDNKLGEKNGRRWETDNFESTAGIIAFTFRNNLNKPKSEQSDYINATKECFARAMQQYFVMKQYGDDVEIVYGYGNFSVPERISNQEIFVSKENFNAKIKPLIEQFLSENKDFFSAELQMEKVVEEIKETTSEIVPVIETKSTETNEFEEIIDLGNNFEIRVKKVFYESGDSTYGASLYYKNYIFKYFVVVPNTSKKEAIDNVYKYLKTLKVSDKIAENSPEKGNYSVYYSDRGGEHRRIEDSRNEIEQFIKAINSITNKPTETNDFDVSKIKLKGVTTIFTEDNGKTLIYGTKNNQTRISVLNLKTSEIKEELDFEKQIYEKTKKDISEFNESEIKNSYAFSTKEKLDIIKLHNQSILKNEERKKLIIPFLESHLKDNQPTETNELQEAIETLEMLLETLEGEDKKEVQEALEILQMLNEN